MKTADRNQIFAEAFHYLKRNCGIKTQGKLAEKMKCSEDTITRILHHRTEVSEDVICKLQQASGDIFNLNWLRGEVARPMLAKDIEAYEETHRMIASEKIDSMVYPAPQQHPHEPMPLWAENFIEIISKQVAQIEELRTELKSYKHQISQLTDDIKSYQSQLSVLSSQIADLSPGIHKNR